MKRRRSGSAPGALVRARARKVHRPRPKPSLLIFSSSWMDRGGKGQDCGGVYGRAACEGKKTKTKTKNTRFPCDCVVRTHINEGGAIVDPQLEHVRLHLNVEYAESEPDEHEESRERYQQGTSGAGPGEGREGSLNAKLDGLQHVVFLGRAGGEGGGGKRYNCCFSTFFFFFPPTRRNDGRCFCFRGPPPVPRCDDAVRLVALCFPFPLGGCVSRAKKGRRAQSE